MNVLTVKDLTKAYGHSTALSGISLTLEAGRIYGLVGSSGAGKTTLFRILEGLAAPDSGTVTLFGQSGKKELREARRRMGFYLPRESFSMDMTALDNLVALQKLRGYQDQDKALALLGEVGIDKIKATAWKLQSLSTGECQRTAVAACLLGDPELLLLDEPMEGMDADTFEYLKKLLTEQAQQGKTVLISAVGLEQLHLLATEHILLHQGKIVNALPQVFGREELF